MDEAGYKKHQAKFGRALTVGDSGMLERPKPTKRSKFGNVKTVVDGIKHDSKREARRYRELGLLLKSGEIDFLARQVRFLLTGGVEYVADFVYGTIIDPRNLTIINPVVEDLTIEDAKGHRTREFINKKKQVKALFGIDVVEV